MSNDKVPDRKVILAHMNKFNHLIRQLLKDLRRRLPNDTDVWRIDKRVGIAIDTIPSLVVDLVGFYLYRYREQIIAGNDQFFVENTYDFEIREAVEKERMDLTMMMIPKIKGCWANLSEAEKVDLRKSAKDLLFSYVDYGLALRGE